MPPNKEPVYVDAGHTEVISNPSHSNSTFVQVIDTSGNHNNAFHDPSPQNWTDGVPGIIPNSVCALDGSQLNYFSSFSGGPVKGAVVSNTWDNTNFWGVADQTIVFMAGPVEPGGAGFYNVSFDSGLQTDNGSSGTGGFDFFFDYTGRIYVGWTGGIHDFAGDSGGGSFDPTVSHLFAVRAKSLTTPGPNNGGVDVFVDGSIVWYTGRDGPDGLRPAQRAGPYKNPQPSPQRPVFQAEYQKLQGFAWFPRALSDSEITGIITATAPAYQAYLQGLGPDVLYMLDEIDNPISVTQHDTTVHEVDRNRIDVPGQSVNASEVIFF